MVLQQFFSQFNRAYNVIPGVNIKFDSKVNEKKRTLCLLTEKKISTFFYYFDSFGGRWKNQKIQIPTKKQIFEFEF